MNQEKKKELQAQYKNMHHEMGVVSFKCTATGDAFLAASKNTKSTLNSTQFQLEAGNHPNKALQALWKEYGPEGFACSVLEVLDYDDPTEDYSDILEEMRQRCFPNDFGERYKTPETGLFQGFWSECNYRVSENQSYQRFLRLST